MGQRLNIEIVKNQKTIANCYYHWSAYTISALATALVVIKAYEGLKDEVLADEVLAVKMLENCDSFNYFSGETNYAGLSLSSYNYMKDKYPQHTFNEAIDRNAGLIGVTEEDMDNTRGWEEGRLIIDLDTKLIDNSGVLWFEDRDEYESEYLDEDEEINYDELEFLPYDDLSKIPFDKLEEVLDELSKPGDHMYKSGDPSEIIMFIE